MRKKTLIIFIFLILQSICVYSQENYPQRIISLSPTITEELYLLGVENKLIGCTIYCETPPEAREKEKVGTVKGFNLEKVVALQPDLVLTTTLVKQKSKDKLKNVGIEVITFPTATNFNDICRQFLKLGIIVGKEEKAKNIIKKAKDKTNAIRGNVRNLPKPKVFAQIGAKPLFAATKDYSINDFIEFAGGINITRDLKNGLYSREEVLRNNPDVIFIVTMGIVGDQEKTVWEKYKVITAVKDKRIYVLDSNKLCSPTPVSFVDTLEEVVEILHQ
ncbi:MAG: ABC transporter substrate-binding protein [Candidatus Omnitrophica bacterium]|nr:ABC transporter substrate-binding protein [Candidatus Omnitrophota bacterium]